VLFAWQSSGILAPEPASARAVVERHGARPDDVTFLRACPARASAGAIASIAFDRPEPAVDGNVKRVLCRIYALFSDPRGPRSRKAYGQARELVPEARRDFNRP
jgi:A/G-specific adenine glycosylase